MNKYVVLSVLVVLQVLGDVCLSRGMRQFSEAEIINPLSLFALAGQVLTSPSIVLGICFLIASLLLYLAAISRLDLSYVVPMTAFKYVLSACLAAVILRESISQQRWLGTGLVSSGVLLVILGEEKPRQPGKDSPFSGLVLAPVSFLMTNFSATLLQSRALIGIGIMALASSLGDMLLAAGMKQVGEVTTINLRSLLRLAHRTFTNPLIGLGILCLTADFFWFITLLSWVDLSLILPMTTLSYPISILGSHYILKEKLTTGRIAGTGLIGIGVAFISMNLAP